MGNRSNLLRTSAASLFKAVLAFLATTGLLALASPAHATTFPYFSPANGVLKGNASSYITTSASVADIVAMFSGTCNSSTALLGNGSCGTLPAGSVTSVGLSMPSGFSVAGSPVTSSGTLAVTTTLNGVLKGNGSGFTASTVALTSEVSGILPAANGGTANGFTAFTGPTTSTKTFTLPNATATILTSNAAVTVPQGGTGTTTLTGYVKGNGTSAFTASATIPYSDLTGTPAAALTKADDTNVTLTLGGSPSTALVNAASITAGWTGTLAASRGGLGMSTVTDDTIPVANGTTWQSKALTDCDAATSAVTYDTTTNAFGCNTINGATGANPTGSIGLSAVNGSASTFTRSDGTPALSQSISPTWTGTHKFTGTAGVDTTQKNVQLGSRSTLTSLIATNNTPATNAKAWEMQVSATGTLGWLTLDDGLTTGSYLLQATRSGSALSVVSFGNATDNPTYTFNGTGLTTLGGNLLVSGTASTVGDGSSSAAQVLDGAAATTRSLNYYTAGSPRWVVRTNNTAESGSNAGSNFEIERRSDAGAALGTPLSINRSTGAVTINAPSSGTALTVSGTVAATAVTGDGSGLTALDAGDISAGTLPVARGGTGVTSSTGSGSVVLSTSPTLVTPVLGTPTSATLTNATGLPLTTGVTGILPAANGGTANGFTAFSGPATSTKTFTLPNASATILTDNAAVTAVQGGTGQTSYTTGDILYASSGTALSKLAAGTSGQVLTSNGAGVAPSYQAPAGSSCTTGSFTGTVTGMTATTTGTIYYRVCGNVAYLWTTSPILGTSNTNALSLTGLPAAVTPTSNHLVMTAGVYNNSLQTYKVATAGADSTVTFWFSDNSNVSTGFTSSGSKGLTGAWTMSYPLD